MIKSRFSILISLATCLIVAFVGVGRAITAAVDRGLHFIFAAIPSPAMAFAGPSGSWLDYFRPTFADPRVDRHEAGFSRLAAARGR